MVELKKKGGITITQASPPSTLAGVCAVYVLNGDRPYTGQNVTPSNLSVSVTES